MGGEVYIGYKSGGSEGWNEYGQRPWQEGFKDDKRFAEESKALYRFPDRVGSYARTSISRHVVPLASQR